MAEEGPLNRGLCCLALIVAATVGCTQSPTALQPSAALTIPNQMNSSPAGTPAANVAPMSSSKGIGGAMPAFYDGKVFTISFKELPAGGEDANLAHNGSINTIYMSDGCMPGGRAFVSVLDAIQGDGFNPLWREVQVVFN